MEINIVIDTSFVDGILGDVEKFKKKLALNVARAGVSIMQDEAPVNEGTLRSRIYYELDDIYGGVNVRIISGADYTKFVVKGRRPVYPVYARALHFFINGREIFTKYASEVKPNDFISRSEIRLESEVQRIIDETFSSSF